MCVCAFAAGKMLLSWEMRTMLVMQIQTTVKQFCVTHHYLNVDLADDPRENSIPSPDHHQASCCKRSRY